MGGLKGGLRCILYSNVVPASVADLQMVSTVEGVADMRQAILPEQLRGSSGGVDTGSTNGKETIIVGLDCEWAPYGRKGPKTPVALLQVRYVMLFMSYE